MIVACASVLPRLPGIASFRWRQFPLAMPRSIRNGVGFLGYLVWSDYLFVRRRIVSRLKARLRDYEQKLVRPRSGHTLFRHDPATLAGLRATWASYRAHLKMASSYRLWQRLVSRSGWVRHFLRWRRGCWFPVRRSCLCSRPSRTSISSSRIGGLNPSCSFKWDAFRVV